MSEKKKRFFVSMYDVLDRENGRKLQMYEIIDLLNELNDENKKLRQEKERWKTLYEIKDKEVTARVDTLNKVCEYYTSEVLFKSDTDPNKAVKEVINRILNTEVEMW